MIHTRALSCAGSRSMALTMACIPYSVEIRNGGKGIGADCRT